MMLYAATCHYCPGRPTFAHYPRLRKAQEQEEAHALSTHPTTSYAEWIREAIGNQEADR